MVEFKTNRIPEMLIEKLTKAELDIYIELLKISEEQQTDDIIITLEELLQKSFFKSKGTTTRAIKKMIDKGILQRERVLNENNRHSYKYHIVKDDDLLLTKLFQDLPLEEQKKYVKPEYFNEL